MVNGEDQFVSVRDIKTRLGVWVYLPSFLNPTPNIDVWATHRFGRFT